MRSTHVTMRGTMSFAASTKSAPFVHWNMDSVFWWKTECPTTSANVPTIPVYTACPAMIFTQQRMQETAWLSVSL